MNGQWMLKFNLLMELKNLTLISGPDIVSSASVCHAHAVKHNLTTDVTKGANYHKKEADWGCPRG